MLVCTCLGNRLYAVCWCTQRWGNPPSTLISMCTGWGAHPSTLCHVCKGGLSIPLAYLVCTRRGMPSFYPTPQLRPILTTLEGCSPPWTWSSLVTPPSPTHWQGRV